MTNQTNIHKQTIINKAWNMKTGKWDFSFVFAFQTKDQYLQFRQLWKQNYAELSGTIRQNKSLIKVTMRSQEYAGKLQSEAHTLSAEATVQLSMLHAAKHEANRQYLTAKQMAQ